MTSRSLMGRQSDLIIRRTSRLAFVSATANCSLMDLPSDLIVQIISRLPLKFVLQCKLVCKQWYRIIKNNPYYFSQIYSKNPYFFTFLISRHIPRKHRLSPDKTETYLVEVSEDDQHYTTTLLRPRFSTSELKVHGSCKGLLCLSSDKEQVVYIWNPIFEGLESYITLPQHKVDRPEKYVIYYMFGYSCAVNKFKVLKLLVHRRPEDHRRHKVKGLIITVGEDNVWRCLPDLFDFTWFRFWEHQSEHSFRFWENNPPGVIVNGVFHWILDTSNNECINTFDFGEEKKGIMSSPCSCPPSCLNFETLTVLNGQLSVIEIVYGPAEMITIWTMNEYGGSWSRIDILGSCFNGSLWGEDMEEDLFLAGILKNGYIMYLYQGFVLQLNFYDPRLKQVAKFEDIRIRDRKLWLDFNGLFSYAPCFVALKDVIGAKENWRTGS